MKNQRDFYNRETPEKRQITENNQNSMTTIVIILIIAAWTVLSLYGACALYKSWGAADAGSAMPIRTLLFWFVIWFIWPLLPFWLLYRLIKRAG